MYDLTKIELKFLTDTTQRIENVDDKDYFGEAYKDFISNSMLKLINPEEGGAPTKFLEGFSSTKSSALELGSAVHQMILEKEKFFLNEVDKPSGKVGPIADTIHQLVEEGVDLEAAVKQACVEHEYYKSSLTQKRLDDVLEKSREYLDFLKQQSSEPGSIVLSALQKDKLYGCLESTKGNKLIMGLLNPPTTGIDEETGLEYDIDVQTFNEDVMTMEYEATFPDEDPDDVVSECVTTKFKIKAKIDNWTVDHTNKIVTLNDLKTTGKPLNSFGGTRYKTVNAEGNEYEVFKKGSFHEYHYHRQMGMYGFILKQYAIKQFGFDDTWTLKVNMLVVETNKPYMSHAFTVGTKWLTIGYYEFLSLLKRVSYHKEYGFDKFIEMDFEKLTEI